MRIAAACALALMLSWPTGAQAQERYALGLFHYNIQYVCGGLVGFVGSDRLPRESLDPAAVEDSIVVQSFAPVLELYQRHPTWGVDIELQAYFLDVLAERHPAVLDMLREMATSGQIDVVSFHYSDQLFIAYPQVDWEHSNDLTRETFERHGVPLSEVVFCQEGQSGMALADRMAERGYRIMVWPKNLWLTQHGDFDTQPLYRFGDILMIAGSRGVSYTDAMGSIEVSWTFLDDGELLSTDDANPYLLDGFILRPEAVAAYETRLMELEAGGTTISTISDYVAAVERRVTLAEPPPLLDGTWQPGSTGAVLKWMGGRSLWSLLKADDRDNHVRTLGYLAHRELMAAETAAAHAGMDARPALDSAWRLLALGQVTDASGINPYRGEVEYGLAHLTEALRIARDVIEEARTSMGAEGLIIDPFDDTVTTGSEPEPVGEPAEPLLEVVAQADDPDRMPEVTWERMPDGHHRVIVRFGAALATSRRPHVEVTFRGELTDELVTTLALDDERPFTFLRSDFAFDLNEGQGDFYIPLPLGLISIGAGRYLIKDTGFVHLAAHIFRDSGDVGFSDDTLWSEEAVTWVFHIFEGTPEEAVELARRLNSHRRVSR